MDDTPNDDYRRAIEMALAAPIEVAREAPAMLAILRGLIEADDAGLRRERADPYPMAYAAIRAAIAAREIVTRIERQGDGEGGQVQG